MGKGIVKCISCLVAYLVLGTFIVKLLSVHPESMVHGDINEYLIGVNIVIWPAFLIFDGFKLLTYELGSLVKWM